METCCSASCSGACSLQTDSPDEMHSWIRDIELKIQEFRGPPKVILLFLLLNTALIRKWKLDSDSWFWCFLCVCYFRVHSNVPLLCIGVRTPLRLVVITVTWSDPPWSSPALWRRAGSLGPPSHPGSPPSWMQRTRTALSSPSQTCPLSPPPPPLLPPPPPPTPSLPLAPARTPGLPPADWGSSRRQETRRAAAGGTALSLSLSPAAASPSAWMTTASAPQTSSSLESRVWTPALVPVLKWMWLLIIVFPANEVTLWLRLGAPCWSCRCFADEGSPSRTGTRGTGLVDHRTVKRYDGVVLVQRPLKTWIVLLVVLTDSNIFGTCTKEDTFFTPSLDVFTY